MKTDTSLSFQHLVSTASEYLRLIMKYWTLTLFVAFASGSYIFAQADGSSEKRDFGLSQVRGTITSVDQQFDENQAEILDEPASSDETGEALPDAVESAPPPVLPDEVVRVEISPSDVYMEFAEAEENASSMSLDDDTISVDFPNEDVRNIVRNVADLYELNVVIPDGLVGSVSLRLRDVTWRQVFDVVLEPLNFTWIEDRNIIKIKSNDDMLAEPVVTRVFVINFAQAGDLQGSIAPMIDSGLGGRIQVDARSNALVITERPSKMNDLQAIIERLDRPTDQVMIESKFVEVTKRDSKNLGINWSSLSNYQVGAGPFNRVYSGDSGKTRSNGNETSDGSVYDIGTGITALNENLDQSAVEFHRDITRLDTAVFNADAFNVVLSALESNNDVTLVSNPTVVTMNNTAAKINIGEEYPIPSYNYNSETGNFEVSGFEYKPIGIILDVTPQVNSAGFINLVIAPEISSQTGEVQFDTASIPIVTTRKTQSTVTIKSGFTLAIGGLMQSRKSNIKSKVPFLGSIPILGRAFQSKNDEVEDKNMIIFITAKVLNPDGSTYRDVFSDRTLNEMGINYRDVPGYEPTPSEQALFDDIQTQRDNLEQLKAEIELRKQLELLRSLNLDKQKDAAKKAAKEQASAVVNEPAAVERDDGSRILPRRQP